MPLATDQSIKCRLQLNESLCQFLMKIAHIKFLPSEIIKHASRITQVEYDGSPKFKKIRKLDNLSSHLEHLQQN